MHLSRRFFLTSIIITGFLLSGCAQSGTTGKTLSYPKTNSVLVTFQEEKVPPQCKVFSQRLVATPMQVTGKQIQEVIIDNAKSYGADMLFLGLARENSDLEAETYTFSSYGPKSAYSFQKRWNGWKYGFGDWNDGGEIISFGFSGWDNDTSPINHSLLIRVVYLTCQLGPSKPGQ